MKAKLFLMIFVCAGFLAAASISGFWARPCLIVKGQECTFEWTRTGPMADHVNITLWLSGVKRAEILNVPNPEGNNEKTWMVPASLPTGRYVIRVATTGGLFQDEIEPFLDQKGMVVVSGPSGTVMMGTGVSFTWHGFGLGVSPTTYHDLYRNGALVGRIGTADMSHSSGCGRTAGWTVGDLIDPDTEELLPTKALPGTGYRIRVTGYGGEYYDETDAFSIAAKIDPGWAQHRFKVANHIPVGPVPGCPMCGAVQLQEVWKILENAPDVQEIQLWQGGRMLGQLVERGGAGLRPAHRRIEFGGSFAQLQRGDGGFELRLFGAQRKLLHTQAVVLEFRPR